MSQKWNRLQELRKSSGLTQEELALRLGMNRSTLANYESGDREPDFDGTRKIAEFFKVSVDFLLDRTDDARQSTISQEWKVVIATAVAKGYDSDQVLKALELLDVMTKRLKAERAEEQDNG